MSAAPIVGLDPEAVPTALEYSEKTDHRSRRKREVRAASVYARDIGKRRLELEWEELGDISDLPQRPRTRAECKDGPRPCPFVSCQHHMYLDVADSGTIKFNFPDLEPDQLEHSCALDLAARGGMTLEEVGTVMNVTRERARQIEEKAVRKMKARGARLSAYQGHAHDFDHAELIAPSLPIVSRTTVEARIAATMPAPVLREPQEGSPPFSPGPADVRVGHAAEDGGGPSCGSPAAEFVASPTEEVPTMSLCTNGCGRKTLPGKLKHPGPPGTEGMCFRCIRLKGGSARVHRAKSGAAPTDVPATTMDVRGLSVADLLEAHQLAQVIGLDVLRALAARIQKGADGS